MSKNKSVVDRLAERIIVEEQETSTEEYVPPKCIKCKNALICSPLVNFISLAKWGIIVEVKECTYDNQH